MESNNQRLTLQASVQTTELLRHTLHMYLSMGDLSLSVFYRHKGEKENHRVEIYTKGSFDHF